MRAVTAAACLATALVIAAPGSASPTQELRGLLGPEEGETLAEWTGRWLQGPVQHIITEEERSVYESLETTHQRLRFIRLFWERRDPQARGPANEFLEEFERRVAYADERFGNGEPGWNTVFGQVVLVFGPPDRTFRTGSSSPELSERPLIVWSYDDKIPEWPLQENLLFVYRFGSWRLLPHSETFPTGGASASEVQRDWEASSTLHSMPSDFYRVQKAVVAESLVQPVDYSRLLDRVEAAVTFPEAQVPFAWEATFGPGPGGATKVDLVLRLPLESLIFHVVDGTYRTEMRASATLFDADGEPAAETSEAIHVEVPLDELPSRAGDVVDRVISLQAPAGSYTLHLVLEDALLGYRTSYRATLEVQ